MPDEEWLALSDALEKLEALDKKKAEFIKLRYFVGLSLEEAAEILGVSVPTASRWWSYSRAWLAEEIESQRKSGYRDTAAASREIVDNAIEAGADQIHVVFDVQRESKRELVKAVSFIDNGSGMTPEILATKFLEIAGTHKEGERSSGGFGRVSSGTPAKSFHDCTALRILG